MIAVNWLQLTGRALAAWILVAGFFYWFGAALIDILLPWLQWIANELSVHYQAELSLGASDQGAVINIVATVTQNIFQYSIPIAPRGAQLMGTGTLVHALTPLVIFFSLVIAWPGRLRVVLRRVMLGVPIGLAILSCTLPFLLIGHIEEIFYSALQTVAQKQMPMPRIMMWVMFMEMGGLWLLPIVSALGCVVVSECFIFKCSAESSTLVQPFGASSKD